MRYPFKSTFNTRDLGGHPISLTAYTLHKRILRSDALIDLSEEEMQFLLTIKVNTVIDLRSEEEVFRRPCILENKEGFHYYHCPMIGYKNIPEAEDSIADFYYQNILNDKAIFSIMKIIADAEGGVLYQCAAGKDRTGVVSALLLSLVGVPLKDILADYQVSYTYIKEKIDKLQIEYPDLPSFLGQSKIEYMAGFFKLFYKKYKSTEQYLLKIGLDSNDIQMIKSKLLEK